MTARYKPYPEYKPSDVEWIGDVPEHWWVFGGKRIFRQRIERAQVDDEQLAATQQYGVIPQSLYMKENGQKVVLALKGTDSFRHVEENDFVISLRSFQGGIEHSGYSGCVSPAYTVLDAVKQIDFRYYRYLLKSTPYICALQSSTDSLREGKSITYEQFGQISLPLLPMEEQRAIAAFLDRETGKIDRMIGKQERMIELLKEKRQAVISRAVEPRENEEQAKLAFFVDLLPGYAFKSGDFVTETTATRLLRGTNVGVDCTKWDDCVYFEDDATVNAFRLKTGDIVLGMDRPWIKEGARVAQITDDDLPCFLVQRVARLRATNGLQQDYLRLHLQSKRFQAYVEADLTGVSVPHLSPDQILGLRIPVLSKAEQNERVGTVRSMEEKIHNLTAKAEQAIELMKERRTALISAAVTGKIDVRSVTSNAYCVTDDTPELMAAEEQAEYRVKE